MKLLDPYGQRLMSYEGAISVDMGNGTQLEGYFEALQALDGTIVLACFFNNPVPIPTGIITLPIEAVDYAGWMLHPEGEVACTSCNIPYILDTAMCTAVIKPTYMRATRLPDRKLDYLGTRFMIANLLLSQSTNTTPNPVLLSLEGRDIEITPLPDYQELAKRLKAVSGIEATISVTIKTSDGTRHSLDEDAKLVQNLISILRLWSGNKLDWIYGEGLDDNLSHSFEVLHKKPVVRDFSNTFHWLGWWHVDLRRLVEAFFSMETGQPLDMESTKELIDYFVDVCATGPYFEIRALSAATLLDTLVLRYARACGQEHAISEADFKSRVLPKLRESIDADVTDETVKQQLKANIQGAFRTSFRQRLKLLNQCLQLQMNQTLIERVIDARNTLVHEGRFRSMKPEDQVADYSCLLWVDFSALCRLVGYDGELPPSPVQT